MCYPLALTVSSERDCGVLGSRYATEAYQADCVLPGCHEALGRFSSLSFSPSVKQETWQESVSISDDT